MNRFQRRVIVLATVAGMVVLAAAGSSSMAASKKPAEDIKGQTINVLVPYRIPAAVISSFTKATGVKVNYVVTGWDATHTKLVVANTARTYIADVAEFDWSFTGQFAGAKWIEPLESYLPKPLLADLASTGAAFRSGGKTYAACFSNDFRISIYNKKMFAKAGITTFPRTLTELGKAADKLKASGVQYPLSIPMAATEGGVTPWYLLTLANGGNLFDKNFKPIFQKPGSAGYKALQFEALAVKKGWVSPGAVSLDDANSFDKFTAGQTAIVLATGPGNLVTANDKSQSSIAGQAVAALVPGLNGPEASFGLPEGLSIPVSAKHKAAAAAFIEWWQKPANAISIYEKEGNLPCGSSVIKQLAGNGKLAGGKVLAQELKLVKPLFPQGAPVWYSQFSSDAQGLVNAAVKGQMSVSDALSQLASKATAHATA
jgi:multiple sugar transport system substrate-binding protein